MSGVVRVNLLPPELAQHAQQRRVAVYAGAGAAVWIAVLAGLYGLQATEVAEREQARANEQAQVSVLQAEVAALAPYGELAAAVEHKNSQLSIAMADEISWARVMNEVSLAFPADASLQTFAASVQDVASAEPGQVSVGEPVAAAQFTGYSVDRFAPGVEALLLDMEDVRSFYNLHLNTAADAEVATTPVTNFTGSSLMDEQAHTGRYASGLPAEDQP